MHIVPMGQCACSPSLDRLASEPSPLGSSRSEIRYRVVLPHRPPRISPRNRTRRGPRGWWIKLGGTGRGRASDGRRHNQPRRRMWLDSRLARTQILCVSNRETKEQWKRLESTRVNDHVSPKHFRPSVTPQIEINYHKCIWLAFDTYRALALFLGKPSKHTSAFCETISPNLASSSDIIAQYRRSARQLRHTPSLVPALGNGH